MYVGDGSNAGATVHVLDAAHLFRLALEKAPAGAELHAVGDEGIPVKAIAEALATRLDLPTRSVEAERLGFYGMLQTVDHSTTATKTRQLLGWEPSTLPPRGHRRRPLRRLSPRSSTQSGRYSVADAYGARRPSICH